MEPTKQDKRHIDDLVRKMELRMKAEATEYQRACERYYYQQLRDKVQMQLDVIDEYQERVKQVYND